MFLPPPKGLSFAGSWSWMMSSARHALSNQQAQLKQLRLVNLTENDAKLIFKAPCLVPIECGLQMTYCGFKTIDVRLD